ncbi:MAG: hypothetical protein AB8I08_07475 [Sandaracinaceae bacterium]
MTGTTRSRLRVSATVGLLALLASCVQPAELSVDLRTDVPRDAFDAVVTTVQDGSGQVREVRRPLSPGEGFRVGGRVADVVGVGRGTVEVEVQLEDAGEVVAGRRVRVTVSGDFALTVSVDAACRGVACSGDTPSCAAGTCVRMECGGGVPGACGTLSCSTDAQCALPGCAVAHCEHGGCVCAPGPRQDAGASDAEPLDAGPPDTGPPCDCMFEEVDTERRACGCGTGMESRTRTCDGCRYGEFGPWMGCEAECGPGDVDEETRPCGPCGGGLERRARTCGATCAFGSWGEWSSCDGAGACAPGATRSGCDPCGREVCTSACTWGACEPFEAFECLRIRPGTAGPPGNNYRCCGSDQWQFCLDTCMWSAVCEACTECLDC